MKREEIEKWVDRQLEVAERNFQAFQETGNPRYDGERRRREDAAEIGMQALNTAADHEKMITYKLALAGHGAAAKRLIREWDEESAKELIKQIVSDTAALGIIAKEA